MVKFETWHPWTFSAEAIFQILIMLKCLKFTPIADIENSDLFAIYITIVVAIDALLDNFTDFLYDLSEKKESFCPKFVQLLKVIYNFALAYLGYYLWN